MEVPLNPPVVKITQPIESHPHHHSFIEQFTPYFRLAAALFISIILLIALISTSISGPNKQETIIKIADTLARLAPLNGNATIGDI